VAASDRGAARVDRAVAMLTNRLEELEHEGRSVSTRVSAAENAVAEGRSTLEARLDAIAALVGDALAGNPEITRLVEDLTRRLERIESSRLTVTAPPRIPGGVEEDILAALAELQTRIDGIERDREDAAAELARTAAVWASEGASLRERVSELAAHIVTGPVPGDGGSAGGPFLQEPEELDRLRIGMEGLRMRLAYHEKEVAELARSGRGSGRVDELATRVDQLSALVTASLAGGNANVGRIDSPGSAAGTNDAATLWSRLARTEEAAKKDREAVLESLERIASRIDSRLQHLETVGSGDGGHG
jgi:hypothetical protein